MDFHDGLQWLRFDYRPSVFGRFDLKNVRIIKRIAGKIAVYGMSLLVSESPYYRPSPELTASHFQMKPC